MVTLSNRLYYLLRPMLPWRVRIGLRRWRAAYRRTEYAGEWPIDERAGERPPNWPGWPEGKRFAFVLSHDVEGPKGLKRVKRLVEMNARYGFRASFNFVPEGGGYQVSGELRAELERSGFEVGVHGLSHDGRMYFSKEGFAREVRRIQEYVKEWGASGFRSPLMHHHMSWMHLLGTEYDASTFDTDPFEPMPDGVGTIFPFWITGENGSGLVELPYTLVQDFTLFKVLEEKTVEIWKRKLDWVAERGGMALLNTHPDYMCMEGRPDRDEYPAALWEEFLDYAARRYGRDYWHGTPREVARYYMSAVPVESRNTRKRVCMVTHSFYESDNRVRRYAETLAKRGDRVEVYALSDGVTQDEDIAGVRVFRIQKRRHEEKGKWGYFWPLLRFLTVSSTKLARRHRAVRYDLVHVHNIPDFLVFAAWYPKWTGVKVILDIHDIVPELFANKFRTGSRGLLLWMLKLTEKVSTAFADHVIIANHLWYERLVKRSVAAEKCSVVLNHVDDEIFKARRRTRDDGKVVIIFPGSFQWHQGLDIAVRALARVREKVPEAELHLYGSGGGARAKSDLLRLAKELGLNGSVKFPGSVQLHEIPELVANADVGIVPKRADSFGNEAYSTKIMEFMSQGIPVVASRTKVDEYYFDEKVVRFFPSGDSEAMAAAIVEVLENRELRERLVKAGREYVERNSWKLKKGEYIELVDRLTTESFEGAGLRDWRSTKSIR